MNNRKSGSTLKKHMDTSKQPIDGLVDGLMDKYIYIHIYIYNVNYISYNHVIVQLY